MKKTILNIICAVSLLSVACTQEVLVSRNYDIDAEVIGMQTKMELSTLYCNINDAAAPDLQKLGEYLTEKSVDVAMLIAPAKVAGTDFKTWLDSYAAANGLTAWESRNDNGLLSMAALVKAEYPSEKFSVVQGTTLKNAVLHIKVNGIHFVVTEIAAARNAIPSDWKTQVSNMQKNKKTVPLVYDPDNLAERRDEVTNIVNQTMDNSAFLTEKHWVWAVDTNAPSSLEMVKYNKEFAREDCYDDVTEEFLTTENAYFSISELLSSDDNYFAVNDALIYNGLVDCNAVRYSVFTPAGVDGLRHNLLYASDECWNMFQTFEYDRAAGEAIGANHYPILVTLKSEE